MTEQLNLFAVKVEEPKKEAINVKFDLSNRFEIGDTVEVTAVPRNDQDVETQFYYEKYTGKKGKLIRIIKQSKPVAFEIDFGKGWNGIFNETEIRKLGGESENEKTIGKSEKENERIEGAKRSA